jgi:NAD+ kinase
VVSTPTGSTAYNLSAGGPVVCPSTNLIVVTPISPHSLSARSVVLSDRDTLRIQLERARVRTGQAVVTFDGQTGQPIEPGDVIEIARSEHDAHMVRERNVSFYEVLRNKMH